MKPLTTLWILGLAAALAQGQEPLDRPTLTQADFEYLGSFKTPLRVGKWSTAWSTGGLTHRYVKDQLHFLSTSHVYSGGLVYEMNYPGLAKQDPRPQARVVHDWGDIYTGHKWVDNDKGSARLYGSVATFGLLWDEPTKRLYWNYGHLYNATNSSNPCFGYSTLDDTTGTAKGIGAWRLEGRSEKYGRGGCVRLPKWFANAYTGGKSLGVGFGGNWSVITTASLGPALCAVTDPDVSTQPDRSFVKTVPLVGYPFGAPGRVDRCHRNPDYITPLENGIWNPRGGVGFWTWSDVIYGGGVWIDTPTRHGFLVFPSLGQGKVWYEKSDRHTQGGSMWWMVYDPKDLARVATGRRRQWQIQPASSWKQVYPPLEADRPAFSGDPGNMVGGATFDPNTNTLYLLVTHVYKIEVESYPMIYAWRVRQ